MIYEKNEKGKGTDRNQGYGGSLERKMEDPQRFHVWSSSWCYRARPRREYKSRRRLTEEVREDNRCLLMEVEAIMDGG